MLIPSSNSDIVTAPLSRIAVHSCSMDAMVFRIVGQTKLG
jgi:hypothetical protein